ncbi:MAG: FadR family transcriptional regulator [Ardenticatenaceae bacterium]|nr:FadR family transcriptional regulator [Ardenticatenaceae bacterium]
MIFSKLDSEFLKYLVSNGVNAGERLPTLSEIGSELGMSVGKLREQLEVARCFGLVSVRPRVGIVREPFDFATAVLVSVLMGLGTGEASFSQFSQVRQAIEKSFWQEAVEHLTIDDKIQLKELVNKAWSKLRGNPIHVPNLEHREFHLTIFGRLDNPFVKGILEAYWDAYEASEMTRFVDYQYWLDVWNYHEAIAEALYQNELEQGRQLLIQHFELLPKDPVNGNS